MSKKFELWRLEHRGATLYNAIMYNRLCGYYKEHLFIGYTKKEVFKKLRNEHDCTISRDFG